MTPRPTARRAVLLALVWALVSAAVGPARAGELDLWPFVVRDGRAVAGLRTTRIAGPFFESFAHEPAPDDAGAIRSGWTLRPFAAHLERGAGDDLEFLHPLGELRRRTDRTRLRLTPFADRVIRAESEDGASSWTAGLAFGGRSAEGERYGGVFPLAGTARKRFGLERLDFLLFPLFGRSRDESGFVRTHVLWPFFSWGSGGGRSLLRIWPFYGRDVREGEWDRRFAAWPFVHWRTEKPGAASEQRVLLVLPFYGEMRSSYSRSWFAGGPLFARATNDRSGARSTDVLWPFFRVAETPPREGFDGASELRIEPFYRRRSAPGYERRSALFGAIDRVHSERQGVRHDALYVGFVNRFEEVTRIEEDVRLVRRDVWPLFSQRERSAPGRPSERRLRAPWILPVAGGGFDRHAAGLLTFYESRELGAERRSDWLYGLARSREAPGFELDAISWLFRRERGPTGTRWRVLGIPFGSVTGSAAGSGSATGSVTAR